MPNNVCISLVLLFVDINLTGENPTTNESSYSDKLIN